MDHGIAFGFLSVAAAKALPSGALKKITEPIPATNLRRETRIIFAPQSDAVVIPTEHFVDRVEH